MSDNLLLTLLGAVSVGALVMGMNQNENDKNEIIEEYNTCGIGAMTAVAQPVAYKNGVAVGLNYASPRPSLVNSMKAVQKMTQQGVPQGQQLKTLQGMAEASTNSQKAMLMADLNNQQAQRMTLQKGPVPMGVRENYTEQKKSLGSSDITRNDYASWPQYQQTIPLRSPDVKLSATLSYNTPSYNKMGITDVYKSVPANQYGAKVERNLDNSMDYGRLLEGYAPPSQTSQVQHPQPQYMAPSADGLTPASNFIANAKSFKDALDQGNTKYAGDKFVLNAGTCDTQDVSNELLPLGTMESSVGENVVMFDRFMNVSKRTSHRTAPSGCRDLIRGDLPIVPDPCQIGWFQPPGRVQDLAQGALQQIASSAGGSSPDGGLSNFISTYGVSTPFSTQASVNTQYTPLELSLQGTGSPNTVSVSSFN